MATAEEVASVHIPAYANELGSVCASKVCQPCTSLSSFRRPSVSHFELHITSECALQSRLLCTHHPTLRTRCQGPGVLEGGGPTYFTKYSATAAFHSAGAGMQLVDAVVASSKARGAEQGVAAAGFGVCRPPGRCTTAYPLVHANLPAFHRAGLKWRYCLSYAFANPLPRRPSCSPCWADGLLPLQHHLCHGPACTGTQTPSRQYQASEYFTQPPPF
jgi:hypothetical protein